MTKRKPAGLKPLQTGQVWEVADTNLRIGVVGKTLVHYKRYKGKTQGVPNSIASKIELEKFLKHNKAILVKGSSGSRPPGKAEPPPRGGGGRTRTRAGG